MTIPQITSLKPGHTILIGFSEQFSAPYTIATLKKSGKKVYCSLENIATTEQVEQLQEKAVFAEEGLLRSSEIAYFDDELEGCKVFDADTKELIGIISEVWDMPAHPVWAVVNDGMELPVPVTPEVVRHVDIASKEVLVKLPEGLHEIAQPVQADED